ncbi:MAG: hypothetical protein GF311_28520 [Candidatus Lokiarchaeota archaeon]|nr:hypothetical protein [Candidatus Lokiarchaeota archaeon]
MTKIKLTLFENRLVYQVVEMEESLRGKGAILEKKSYGIYSSDKPDLQNNKIYLAGKDKSKDNELVIVEFDNNEEKMNYYRNIKNIINTYNNQIESKNFRVSIPIKWNEKIFELIPKEYKYIFINIDGVAYATKTTPGLKKNGWSCGNKITLGENKIIVNSNLNWEASLLERPNIVNDLLIKIMD